jgi:phage tail protein X
MSEVYRTLDGDMLDAICKTRLGSEVHVPTVLAANPGLAARGPVYPAGESILFHIKFYLKCKKI